MYIATEFAVNVKALPPKIPRTKRQATLSKKLASSRTPEERAASLAIAHRRNAELVRAGANLKQDWLSKTDWFAMALAKGIKLPGSYIPSEDRLILRWLRKIHMTKSEFLAWGGYREVSDFQMQNPRTPLWALIGMLLEYVEERDDSAARLRLRLRSKQ